MIRPFLCICTILAFLQAFAQEVVVEKEYPHPQIFEKDILAFEAFDTQNPPTLGAIVCIGSSSMRGWHPWIREDLAPLSIIPRGFGGSHMNDVLHYCERMVLRYRPSAVVIYEGDNDISQGISPRKIRDTFRVLVARIHKELPQTKIYVISIKPSLCRWQLWPAMKEANALLEQECAQDKRLRYVDVASSMLGPDGLPRKELFLADNLHLNREGYLVWRDILKPILTEK